MLKKSESIQNVVEEPLGGAVDRTLTGAVDDAIASLIETVEPARLREALRQGTIGGKRVRPLLTMLSCSAVGGNPYDALHAACAVELLHASSLVHDDIMDAAATRRGFPSVHALYGNSMAILAGDTLVALAFQMIQTTARASIVSRFSGAFLHVCEGQGYDLVLSFQGKAGRERHRTMVEKKTARLMEAATAIGGMIGCTNEEYIQALERFGYDLGIAFQVKDDLLDVVGEQELLGKPIHADHHNGKLTFVNFSSTRTPLYENHGLSGVVGQMEAHTTAACLALRALPPTAAREHLRSMAGSLLARSR